jgi:FkbM family methyltransferase
VEDDTMKRSLALAVRRVRQTPQLFDNRLRVFFDLATSTAPWSRPVRTFRLRNGLRIGSPNVAGARFPVYEIFADDVYDLPYLLQDLPDRAVVIDAGGQVGCFALAVAHRLPTAVVHTYEASPTTSGYLSRNVGTNGLSDRVVVHNTALTKEIGTFQLIDSGTASSHNGLTAPVGTGHEITVPCTTFDDAVARAGGHVDLVKFDIEGAEYDTIFSSSPASWAGVRKVVMEYHPMPGRSRSDLEAFFAGVGLVAVRDLPGGRPGLGNLWLARA